MGIEEDFAKALAADPDFLTKLQKRESQEEFKSKFNLGRSTPLRCPVCNQYGMSGGSLWISKDSPPKYVCRKCKSVFSIECHTMPIEKLIAGLRQTGEEKDRFFLSLFGGNF